jgi:phage terminase small subunit
MAPHPIPIELKLLRGNRGKRRLPDALPVVRLPEPPSPPAWMGEVAKQEWARWAPALLGELDLGCFAILCDAREMVGMRG